MTLPESAPEAANASHESGEKPLYIWNPRTVRARKWKERRERRKLKKQQQQQEEAEEAETEDDESDDEVEQEPQEQKKVAKKKRKRSTGEGDAAAQAENPQDDGGSAAPQIEAPSEAPQKKKRKKGAVDKNNGDGQAIPPTEGDSENVAPDPEAEAEAEARKAKAQQEAMDVQQSIHAKGFFSEQRYEDLPIVDPLKRALKDNNFVMLTEIQAKSIPLLLNGKDVLAAAKTGSGKTLAFLVPAIDLLHRVKFLPRNGVGAVVISPVRELAQQIYDVLRNISAHVSQTHGVCVGGMNRRNESEKLGKGVNILVATPGRLLDHMQNTKGFVYHNLVNLTIDEADRILEVGFEEEINLIIKMLPKKRQTALFSATQTRKVADLARLSLTKPVFVEVKSKDNVATVQGLTQGYVVCPAAHRFLLLFTFLKRNRDKKVMVFFSSCNSVKFHDELLNYIDIPTVCIHGHKKQAARSSTYYQFCSADKGLLLCTDVAARGLDIPKVDWIVQFDPPDEPKEYIHRVGRTARGADGQGKALLFLMPEELGFLQYLRRAGVPVSEYTFPSSKLSNIQNQLERVIEKNYHLHRSSRDAYRSYMHAYAAHSHKDCFDVYKLDLQQVAKAFGFMHPPKVDLNLKHTGRDKKKGQKKTSVIKQTSQSLKPRADGVTPSAANQYGVATNDKRQFTR